MLKKLFSKTIKATNGLLFSKLGLDNKKGHFLLPALGMAAKAVGTAGLTAAKAAGTGALAAGKAIGTGTLAAGKAVTATAGKFGGQIANAVKDMAGTGGLSSSTQDSTSGQGAGEAQGGNKILDAVKGILGKFKLNKENSTEEIQQPSLMGGGNSPATAIQMPQFTKPQSAGALIAQMLAAKRGF